jgi:hypothetical protein
MAVTSRDTGSPMLTGGAKSAVQPKLHWEHLLSACCCSRKLAKRGVRNVGGLIYLIGLIVVILFILSFLGLR